MTFFVFWLVHAVLQLGWTAGYYWAVETKPEDQVAPVWAQQHPMALGCPLRPATYGQLRRHGQPFAGGGFFLWLALVLVPPYCVVIALVSSLRLSLTLWDKALERMFSVKKGT